MADRVVEIVQKEIGEELERRIREWNVVIQGMNKGSLIEDGENEKEEERVEVRGINPSQANSASFVVLIGKCACEDVG